MPPRADMAGVSKDEVESALEALFRAYDLDESGELSRDEFVKIEMRLAFETGEIYRMDSGAARMTLADKNCNGQLDYDEFRIRFLTTYTEMGMDRKEIVEHVNKQVKLTLSERAKMGPRYHAGIRQVLRQIFHLFDASGDGKLSPEEWLAAQKAVALEVSDELDEGWIDEAAFQNADTNKDGVLDMDEFLESSFTMFEGVKKRTDAILATLQRVAKVLEQQRLGGRKETPPVQIWVQAEEPRPEFQPPHASWQDEGTEEDPDRNMKKWKLVGEVALPLNLATADDVGALIRLMLKLPPDTWLSVFYCGAVREGGPRPVTLLRGDRPGEGNTTAMIQYMTKPNAELKLYVKNMRKRPSKLTRQPRAFLEEREQLLAKRTGQCWGLDWETQLVGDGVLLPPRPLVIKLGDALVIEVPQSDDNGEYRYVTNVYMDGTTILSKPVDENIEPKKSKKKKKAGAEADPLVQLAFVAIKEGKCVLFADVSWEDQEEKLATVKKITTPCAENSVSRIGPIEVEVEKQTGKVEKGTFVWWNGEKWSNKKGPAKRKKK